MQKPLFISLQNMNTAKIGKLLCITFIIFSLLTADTSCVLLTGFRRHKDPEAAAQKKDERKNRKIMKQYKKGVKKYQKEVAGVENEARIDKKDRKVYKRMKKNKRASMRINKNKHPDPWIVRLFKKDRVKDPFYVRWGRRLKRAYDKVIKKE
ncbi:MAG: hypothetical protein KJ607_09965 [Bacteroidetes bacterium]|nr:hypothetical protein [Bacteroidota bacterium]